MGIYVHYRIGSKDGAAGLIRENFNELRDWYFELSMESPEEVNFELLEYLDVNSSCEKALDQATGNAGMIDALFHAFVFQFCLYGPCKLKYIDAGVKYRDYREEDHLVKDQCSASAYILWDFLTHGRSLADPSLHSQYNKQSDPLDISPLPNVSNCTTSSLRDLQLPLGKLNMEEMVHYMQFPQLSLRSAKQ